MSEKHTPDSPPELPADLAWGVDSAIKKLRPWAKFSMYNKDITWWEDPTGTSPPSWDEIVHQMEIDKLVAQRWIIDNNIRLLHKISNSATK